MGTAVPKTGVLGYRTPLEKLASDLPTGSLCQCKVHLLANRRSDSFTSLEIAPRKSNHIPGATVAAGSPSTYLRRFPTS
jgi:hypothetical protein